MFLNTEYTHVVITDLQWKIKSSVLIRYCIIYGIADLKTKTFPYARNELWIFQVNYWYIHVRRSTLLEQNCPNNYLCKRVLCQKSFTKVFTTNSCLGTTLVRYIYLSGVYKNIYSLGHTASDIYRRLQSA